MSSLKAQFTTSPQLQAKYLCFTARSLQLGNFAKGNFVVLPYLVPHHSNCVHFPDLGYSPHFWTLLSRLPNYSLTVQYPAKLNELTHQLLINYPPVSPTSLISAWEKTSPQFFSVLDQLFPQLVNRVGELTVLITDLGTSGSFSRTHRPDGKWDLICTARIDFPVENIYAIALNALVLSTQNTYSDIGTPNWYKRNGIIEFTTKFSALKPYLTYFSPTNLTAHHHLDSQNYLTSLGFTPASKFNPDILKSQLSPSELKLFNCLYSHKGEVVSFDQVADTLWEPAQADNFSLAAMAKLVESLRAKIRAQGINYPILHTLRKRGYLLSA